MAKRKNQPRVIIADNPAMVREPKAKKPKWKRPDLRYRINERGQRIYDIKPSQITEQAFKTLVKQANERLRQIEKRGLQDVSKEYQWVKYFAEEKTSTKGAIYNIDSKNGRIRFSTNINKFVKENEVLTPPPNFGRFKPEEREKAIAAAEHQGEINRRAYMINTLRNFLNAETSTISGIKRVKAAAFATFKKHYNKDFKANIVAHNAALPEGEEPLKVRDLTEDDYFKFWKMYRDNFSDTKTDKYGYNTMKTLLENSAIMALPPSEIQNVMEFAESTRNDEDKSGFVDAVVDMFPELKFDME